MTTGATVTRRAHRSASRVSDAIHDMPNHNEATTVILAEGPAKRPALAAVWGGIRRKGEGSRCQALHAVAVALFALGGTVLVTGCATTRHELVRPSFHDMPTPATALSPGEGLLVDEPGRMAAEDQQRARTELRKRAVRLQPPEKIIRPKGRRPR